MRRMRPVRNPTTSAGMSRSRPDSPSPRTWHSEPRGAPGPLASATSPITSVTRPLTRIGFSVESSRSAREKSSSPPGGIGVRSSIGLIAGVHERATDGVDLGVDADVDVAEARLDDAAALREPGVLEQLEFLHVLERRAELGQRLAEEAGERRRDADDDVLAVDRPPDGGADHAEPDRGTLRELLVHDLPRHAERELEELALVALAEPPAELGELLERFHERLADRLDLAPRLLAPEVVAGLERLPHLFARLAGRRGGGTRLRGGCRRGRRGRLAEGAEGGRRRRVAPERREATR